jgi:RNA polymerase sigma-70 factor (ECF subfamily)
MNIRHDEANDLKQDILVKLWKKLPEFDYQPDKAKFRTWLCQVIRFTALNRIQSLKSEAERIDKYHQGMDHAASDIDEVMAKEWQIYITNQAMERVRSKFSEQSVKVFERTLQGASVEELGKEFDLKENSIYRIKNRVKERLILEIAELRRDLE